MASPSPLEEEIDLLPSPMPQILPEVKEKPETSYFEEDDEYGPFEIAPSPKPSSPIISKN